MVRQDTELTSRQTLGGEDRKWILSGKGRRVLVDVLKIQMVNLKSAAGGELLSNQAYVETLLIRLLLLHERGPPTFRP